MKKLLCLLAFSTLAAGASAGPLDKTECIAGAKPGGGFDLTCKLAQTALLDAQIIKDPMRVTYMPGGIGAVAYNAVVAQRPGEGNTIVAFSGGSLLNLAQASSVAMTKPRCAGWPRSAPTTARSRCVPMRPTRTSTTSSPR